MQQIAMQLSFIEARQLAEDIRAEYAAANRHIASARGKLLELYEREGWRSLGYASWRECVTEEFGGCQDALYKELHAAEVDRAISTTVETPVILPERQARELYPLLRKDEQEAVAVYNELKAAATPDQPVTAALIREAVQERMAPPPTALTMDTRQPMEVTVYSHKSVEYYTPAEILEAARIVLGVFDLDPASCPEAQQNVKAARYYTAADDGLAQPWRGRVWLNPPYSKTDGKSNQQLWAERLVAEYKAGTVSEAILLVKAALGYKWFEQLFMDWPVCFVRERLSFIQEDGSDDGQSKQGTALFYFGANFTRFYEVFRTFGRVIPAESVLSAALREQPGG